MFATWACEVTEILKEALRKPLLCEDHSDITSPTSNHMPDIRCTLDIYILIIKVPADKSNIDILCHKSMDRLQHE